MRKKNDLGRRVACSALSAALAISMCPMVPIQEAIAESVDEAAGLEAVVDSGGGASSDSSLTSSDFESEDLSDRNERPESADEMLELDSDGIVEEDVSEPEPLDETTNVAPAEQEMADDLAIAASSEAPVPGKLTSGWNQIGTCEWKAWETSATVGNPEGTCSVWIRPLGNGESGELPSKPLYGTIPVDTDSITISGDVKISSCKQLFSGFYLLTDLDIDGLNTTGVTDMSYMFAECSKLENVSFSKLDTSSVQDMSYMFSECRISPFDLTKLNTASVINMEGMFYYAKTGGISLDLTSFDIKQVSNMHRMFEGCSKIKSILMGGLDASAVTNASDMFSRCSSLTKVVLPSFSETKDLSLDNCFRWCSSLVSVNLDSLANAGNISLLDAFWGCSVMWPA